MKQHAFRFCVVLLALGLMIGLASTIPANADNLYAKIRGTVVDPSGAVVPDAKVSATNVATGLGYNVTSDKNGSFEFLQLPIGDYSVKIEKSGFKSFTEGHIHLDLDQIFNLKAEMQLGAVSDSITVEANAAQVESTDMQLTAVISGNQIVDIPLNGRNWTQLMQLQPGVQASSDRFGAGAYSTNGSETQQNAFLINGTDSNDSSLNTPLVIPSPDSIGEVSMVSSTINPEYGRNSGSIINAAIKNGTNQFHGSAFEFYRDTFLDAPAWFETKPSPFHQNEYGGTVGGPIIKDHAFFFFSYQGLHERLPESGSSTTVPVYTAAQRIGDFSAGGPFAPPGTGLSPIPLTDSNGVLQPAGTPYSELFPTGKIPTVDLNPIAVKLTKQFVPPPNVPGSNEYQFNPITTETSNQYIYRVDERLRAQDNLWFYGLYQNTPSVDTLPFTGSTLPGEAENAKRHYQEYTADWTHTFSPTTLNEVRFSFLRFNFVAVNPVSPINPTSYGFTGITPQNSALASLPVMTVASLFELGFSSNGPQPRIQNTYQVADNFSKVWGRHTFKAGFSMERLEINNPFYSNLSGNFAYNAAGPFSTGNAGADFLLGFPDNYTQGSGSIVRGRGREYYGYVQDQWQIRPSLTLTLGTGYDIETPWRNLYANGEIMAAWRPGQQSTVFPTAPPGFVYPGDAGINEYGGVNVPYKDFAPRLGFAWSPGGGHNWSIRGGIGLYYNRSEEELALQTLLQPPFALGTTGASSTSSPNFTAPFTTVNAQPVGGLGCANSSAGCKNIPNPFPFVPPSPGAKNIDFATYAPIGLDVNVSDPKLTTPRSTNFNLNIQRQISKSTIVSVGYVGSIGRHEEGAYDTNLAGSYPGVNPLSAASGCPFGLALASCPLQTPTTENANLTWTNGKPVPGATPYNLPVYGHPGIQATAYNSNYNSLQAEFNRHFSNGMQVQASYTWSRYFDQTSNLENSSFNAPGINPFQPRDMYAPSASDAPQRLVVSYKYTLPFYKLSGHRFRRLTDDWNVVGIYTLQHGFPIPVFDLLEHSLTCDLFEAFYFCPDRANQVGIPHAVNPRTYQTAPNGGNSEPGNYWFTNGSTVFPIGAPGSGIGTASRNPLYGPGINYGDMAIEKDIRIDESKSVELRLETFNTFNHANFANPANFGSSEDASAANTATFGQVFNVRSLTTNGDGRVVQLGAKIYF